MLIFLDIDGVMVPAQSWKNPELLSDGFSEFSTKSVRVLQELISEETTIVLTTSHKSTYTIDEWKAIFRRRGITVNKIERLEENTARLSRKDEILRWFKFNTVSEDFIILDDDKSLNDLPPTLKNHLILTSPLIGLTDVHLEEIKRKRENVHFV